ncbi:MAG: GNAT family N-acetyltransferase [Alphaproteobacteria bacterium]|jgi:predicted N-acetyltransferase YhbS|nr:GNAT family N-acetyltransferase [Alphaproteobacteria bacterium]MBT4019123.1 GNAT family N-acetyltransferase [Alphaproteobacteria bacterium]MBT5159985.1 GNAT family N-acetyltransferase [Alphaproteobacteria bacterium]MBT6387709.1 GNAT family N-acetyltransferase [Alphaproteobacteria bacterium]
MSQITIRPLKASDLDEVVEIDRQHVARSRRGFFAKRLEAVLADQGTYIQVGAEADGSLVGYAMARLIDGEFGLSKTAILEAMAVDTAHDHHGTGEALLSGIDDVLKHKGLKSMQTNAAWTSHDLLRFFDHQGFKMAPRHVVECDTSRVHFSTDEDLDANGGTLARDRVYVRLMTADDAKSISSIDRAITGDDRSTYLQSAMKEALDESAIRVSLVAETDGFVSGFVMARMDFGDFGETEPYAVIDTIGVAPNQGHHGIASALISQLLMNLSGLQVDHVRTEVRRENFDLLAFLYRHGFGPSDQLALERKVA